MPMLFGYFQEIMPQMVNVLAASIVMILLLLWIEFRSWQGVVIPAFSGTLSAIWGLGFGGLCAWLSGYVSNPNIARVMNLSMDPLVLVIPLLISARAHSHSVQSMERYHEEYHRLKDKNQAIVKSYTEIYAPAMVSLLADGLATLTLLVARIPLIQKLAILCSFWIISIFVSVVIIVLNTLVDLLYMVLDPRIRAGGGERQPDRRVAARTKRVAAPAQQAG